MMSTMSNAVAEREHHAGARHDAERGLAHLPVAPYFRWKGLLDCGLAAVLLLPALPLIGLLVLLVRASSPGPGIYRQTRVGKNGRHFMMYKIRTMRNDAEAKKGPDVDPSPRSADHACGQGTAEAPPG